MGRIEVAKIYEVDDKLCTEDAEDEAREMLRRDLASEAIALNISDYAIETEEV